MKPHNKCIEKSKNRCHCISDYFSSYVMLSEEMKEFDKYIFDYFNNKYPDEMAEIIKKYNIKEKKN